MKNKLILATLSLHFLVSCARQETSTDTIDNIVAREHQGIIVKRHVSELGLSMAYLNTMPVSERMKLVREKEAILTTSNIPNTKDGWNNLTWQEGIGRYKNFVTRYTGEPFLRTFRDRYAQSILLYSGVLKSEDFASIEFLADELVNAESTASMTIVCALDKLDSHVEKSRFKELVLRSEKLLKKNLSFEEAQAKARKSGEGGELQALLDASGPTLDDYRASVASVQKLKH